MNKTKYLDRELSWLAFNHRVLQEAKDPRTPVYEKIKFLAIFSSNLDEFFRVRVASLRALLNLGKSARRNLNFNPRELLGEIHSTVRAHQEEFGEIYRNIVLPELAENGVRIIDENNLTPELEVYARSYFDEKVRQYIQPALIARKRITPFLRNMKQYFAVRMYPKPLGAKKENPDSRPLKRKYALVEIPTDKLPRFVELPSDDNYMNIMFLDDVVRLGLPEVLHGYEIEGCYAVKLTRDAELYIDDEFHGDLLEKIKKALSRRDVGAPSRFLYDENIPAEPLKFLKSALNLKTEDLVPGGKYHNFSDFFAFPKKPDPAMSFEPLPPLRQKKIDSYSSYFEAMSERDHMCYFPYHSYDHVLEFFREAAADPAVEEILATQYRVARDSEICKSLINAARNGKQVTVFIEIKARFDEDSNIYWAAKLEKAGAKVIGSIPGLKVHAKLAMASRRENGELKRYCYLSTGNFNENNAKIYTDIGLFTADERLTKDAALVFEFLENKTISGKFERFLVAQFNMRKGFKELLHREMRLAETGVGGKVFAKVNAVEDKKMIKALYKASEAGVKIDIVSRGICRLAPNVAGQSDNINVFSVVDRFLEHSRAFIFYNGGAELVYAGSADLMKRNLSRRVEVVFPIYDEEVRRDLKAVMELIKSDNSKARIIDVDLKNEYRKLPGEELNSQLATYEYFKIKEYD